MSRQTDETSVSFAVDTIKLRSSIHVAVVRFNVSINKY